MTKSRGIKMIKQFMLLFISLITVKATCMQHTQELQPWVKEAKQISVRTLVKNTMQVSIDDASTVMSVKQRLEDAEGIPVAQQSLYPLATSWRRLWLTDAIGSKLDNNQNIKQIMNNNSNRFLLVLSLRPQNNQN